ncbi:MAG: class I SAM-dependent methyltransferase [Lachnospiraceae bacterium]|nr:class I SAM-dependent methyltransferase [Lachnospiraceae bacterium]
MECKICTSTINNQIFSSLVLNKYEVAYYQCLKCGLVFTGPPFWIKEAYDDAISRYDTGIMRRNHSMSVETNYILNKLAEFKFIKSDGSFLDFAGGYGIFTRMMRDLGWDFYWHDKYSQNLLARGFEHSSQDIFVLTAFEVFEHFDDPITELKKMLSYCPNILFSTLIYDNDFEAKGKDWWYYTFESGQHISFYSKRTLKYLADIFKLHYYYINDGLHLFSEHDNLPQDIFGGSHEQKQFYWAKNSEKSKAFSDMIYLKKEQD